MSALAELARSDRVQQAVAQLLRAVADVLDERRAS